MNIITNSDVKKFLTLIKAGLKNGNKKELRIHDSASFFDGITVAKSHYVSVEFSFHIDPDKLQELFIEEDAGLTNQIDDLLK